jgi:1-acyl-sn-glycerol-3-phosphate acyltransferase
MMLYVRSALFLVWFALISVVMNIGCLPALALPRRVSVACANLWARLVLLGLKWLANLDVEVRGVLTDPRVLLASKHQSMWETVACLALLPDPAVVMKRSLLKVPLYGWYCRKMKMIPIDREAGVRALRSMQIPATEALNENRPVVIFPEGTRKAPDDPSDYKPGVAALYTQLGVPCVPVAHNSGLFWTGLFLRRPGTIILEYLPAIPPGLSRREFMTILEVRTEEATKRLLAEGRAQSGEVPA